MDKYLSCPLRFKHYNKGTTARPSSSYKVGSCCHHALEVYVDSKGSMDIEEAMNYATTYVQAFKPNVVKEALKILKIWISHLNLPSPEKIIGTEIRFGPHNSNIRGLPVHEGVEFDSGLKIHGIIDILWNDNGTVVIGDYKSSRQYMTDQDLSTKLQAQLYATAIHQIRPDVPIRVEFYMLRYPENGPVIWVPEEGQFKEIEKQLHAYQKRISEDQTFEPQPSEECKWCEYNYCCTAFKLWTKPSDENGGYKLWEMMGVLELVDELDEWFGKYISTKRVVDDIKSLLQEHMERANIEKTANWKITRKSYPQYHEDVAPLIARYGGMTKIRKEYPELYTELQSFKSTKWGRPFLRKTGGW